jgi:preprotein translocase subunit SecD
VSSRRRRPTSGSTCKGGTELIYLAHNTNGTPVNSTTLTDTINIMRSRSDTLGVSGVDIRPTASNEITVDLPNVQNPTQAAKVVGVTGQLYFYDWENSVIGANGKVAGAQRSERDLRRSERAAGRSRLRAHLVCRRDPGLQGARDPGLLRPTPRRGPTASRPSPRRCTVYYYVDAKTQTVYAPNGPEPTKALLDADIAQKHVKLPAAAKLVAVQPGTVLVQATSAPEVLVPNDFYVLRDDVQLTGKEVSNPQVTTDPTQGIAVSFGFKGNGANVFTEGDGDAGAAEA